MAGRRSGWIVAGLVLLGIGILAWWAARGGWSRNLPSLGQETVTVVPGVHHLGGLGPSPAYVVETPAGLVLVDSGLEADAAAVKAALGRLRLDWHRIQAILLTHAHGDHTGGAERLRAETRAKVHAGRGDAGVLRAGGPKIAFFSNFDMPRHEPHPTNVDVELAGGEVLDFGGVKFQAIACPGHSPGSVCYLVEHAGERILFGGDVVMHPNEHDSLGTYTAYLAPAYRGDAREFLGTVGRLRSIPEPSLVLPGHPVQDPPRSPRLAKGQWKQMLDEAEAELTRLLARYETDGPGFLDGVPKRIREGLFYLGDRDRIAVYALGGKDRVFLVNAPGPSGLPGFVRERLAKLGLEGARLEGVLLTSTSPTHSSGVEELTRAGLPLIVAPSAGLDELRSRCGDGARLVAARKASEIEFAPFRLNAFGYRAGGEPLAAYQVEVAGKRALFTAGGLVQFDRTTVEEWQAMFKSSRERAVDFLSAVQKLEALDPPDLWLPARPSEGQNAYLYDHAWSELVQGNFQLGYQNLARFTSLPSPISPPHATP
ncbi:MAG: MBL fold metallo-hydrolase [Isosphaeraceae bacterium]